MRLQLLTTGLIALAAISGCSSGSTVAPAPAPTDNSGQIAELIETLDNSTPSFGLVEVQDLETGTLVSTSRFDVAPDGTFDPDNRGGQDIVQGPERTAAFRVIVTLDTDGPPGHVPRGFSPAGNPLYHYGDTVHYDGSIRLRAGRANRIYRMGSLDISFTHVFATTMNPLPTCAGLESQNPWLIEDVDFGDRTPNTPPQLTWSTSGPRTITSHDMQLKLCGGAGSQPGTDLIGVKLAWTVAGSVIGASCGTCLYTITVFDQAVGIYDP